jgi:hypothetical protein
VFLAQAGDIPNANGLIEGGGYDEVFFGVELCAPDICGLLVKLYNRIDRRLTMVVAGQSGNEASVLPVPDSNGLIVGA